jgi:hypothetical protein
VKIVLFMENQFSWISWVNQMTNLWIQWRIFLYSQNATTLMIPWFFISWYHHFIDDISWYHHFIDDIRPGFVNYKKECTLLAAASDTDLLAHGRWFSPGTPASSTTKTGRHDIAEILLKVALKYPPPPKKKKKKIILLKIWYPRI